MRFARPAYMIMVYLFLYIPIAMLMILSFNDSHFSALWHGFTWRWYQTLFGDTHLLEATWHSLLLATVAATISVSLGTLASISLRRHQFKGRGVFQSGLYLLILAPEIVLGIALLILFSSSRIPFGFLTLLISHVTFCLPFAVCIQYA